MAGVTEQGFEAKTLEQIKLEIEEQCRADISPQIDVNAEDPFGQFIGILSSKFAELWELADVVYASYDPDAAEDGALDNVSAISGTKRRAETKGTVIQTLVLEASKTVPAGSIVAQDGDPDNRWVLLADVTSTFAGSYTGTFESESFGAVAAPAGTLTEIVTSVNGWVSTTNAADAAQGREREENPGLRLRREEELRAAGNASVEAIRGDVLRAGVGPDEPAKVISVNVLNNPKSFPDSNGLPPHSVEVVVYSGITPAVTNAEIAEALFASVAGGVNTVGNASVTVTAANGVTYVVSFSVAVVREVWIDLDLVTTADFPDNGAALVRDALVSLEQPAGEDLVLLRYRAAALTVNGVKDVPAIRAGFSSSPSGTANLEVSPRQIAVVDTSRITVNT